MKAAVADSRYRMLCMRIVPVTGSPMVVLLGQRRKKSMTLPPESGS